MTDDETAEYELLRLATNDTHKFAIQVGYGLSESLTLALERLQLRDWVRLIDISPVGYAPGPIFRVFRVMPDAVTWFARQG